MWAKRVHLCLSSGFWRLPEGVLFLLWLAPPHDPVAASLVVATVILGLADVPTPTSQDASAGFPGERFNLGTPQNRFAFLSASPSQAGPVRLTLVVGFMLQHALEKRL
jgi:hypothetical protein